jgi:hypothetical protein
MNISTGAQHDSRYPPARFNEKGCLLVWCGDALKAFQKVISEQYTRLYWWAVPWHSNDMSIDAYTSKDTPVHDLLVVGTDMGKSEF